MESSQRTDDQTSESPASVISREIVGALKDATGRGPTKARTYFHDECVLVLLREGHTITEGTMADGGEQRAVAQGRVDMSELIRGPLMAIVERNTRKKVVGFLSSSQQDPDLISFVFVLENSPVVQPRGGTPPPAELHAI